MDILDDNGEPFIRVLVELDYQGIARYRQSKLIELTETEKVRLLEAGFMEPEPDEEDDEEEVEDGFGA